MAEQELYLVWSNEHRAWWGPAFRGYVPGLGAAGRYPRNVALGICRQALPTGDRLAEIPVRLADLEEFMRGAVVPGSAL